jgi:hypothetical protein
MKNPETLRRTVSLSVSVRMSKLVTPTAPARSRSAISAASASSGLFTRIGPPGEGGIAMLSRCAGSFARSS